MSRDRILTLWPTLDTFEIAQQLGLPESTVYNTLAWHKRTVQPKPLQKRRPAA